MKIIFSKQAWEDYLHWQASNNKIVQKINTLISESSRTPLKGTGKPKKLRGDLRGWVSRKINLEHRFVYRIQGEGNHQAIEILQSRYHY